MEKFINFRKKDRYVTYKISKCVDCKFCKFSFPLNWECRYTSAIKKLKNINEIPDFCILSDDMEMLFFEPIYDYNTLDILKLDFHDVEFDFYDADSIKYTYAERQQELSQSKKVVNICSLCEEKKENVDRHINNGLCTDCLELIKNDNTLIYKAFINNFRLKRYIKTEKNKNYKEIN